LQSQVLQAPHLYLNAKKSSWEKLIAAAATPCLAARLRPFISDASLLLQLQGEMRIFFASLYPASLAVNYYLQFHKLTALMAQDPGLRNPGEVSPEIYS